MRIYPGTKIRAESSSNGSGIAECRVHSAKIRAELSSNGSESGVPGAYEGLLPRLFLRDGLSRTGPVHFDGWTRVHRGVVLNILFVVSVTSIFPLRRFSPSRPL